jgi:small subunit ribosomal protein S9
VPPDAKATGPEGTDGDAETSADAEAAPEADADAETGAGTDAEEPEAGTDAEEPEAGTDAEAAPETGAGAEAGAGLDATPPPEPTPPRPERARGEPRHGQPEDESAGAEAIPGAHLEPDLVLEEQPETEEPDYSRYAALEPEAELEQEAAEAGEPTAESEPTDREAPEPAPRSALDLAADARYHATGKRKTSVARVVLKPGSGSYTVNGRPLDQFFPRATLQLAARQPLQTVGYEERMDVVARLHGGGVSSQAGALRHGIARALVEADPALRGELKRRGFLTRDARAKERRKAGLKKARKRPQFSKR